MEQIKEKKRSKKICVYCMLLVIVLYCVIVYKMEDISRWYLDKNLTEFGKMGTFLQTEAMQEVLDVIGEHGILWEYPLDYKNEAREAMNNSFESEKAELYCEILFGGFSYNEYRENHSFDEFFDMITEMDLALPEYYDSKGFEYIEQIKSWYNEEEKILKCYYDEEGNLLCVYRKVTFWMCMYDTYMAVRNHEI